MSDECALVTAALCSVVSDLERELTAQFGFTVLSARLEQITPQGEVRVLGTALVPRMAELLRRRLSERLSSECIQCTLTPLPGAGWFRPRSFPARLYRELGAGPGRSLASELLERDGPLERLWVHGPSTLSRGMCGTIGWLDEPPLDACEPPRIAPALDSAEAFVARLREFLGVDYMLGGTTPGGVDCSGLVQRAARDALGLVLPRHSSDQRAFGAAAGAPEARGDLIFTATEREGECHVGVLTEVPYAEDGARDHARVIHASVSRRRVVEEPLAAFTAGATRASRASYSALLLRHAEHVGAAQIRLRG